MPKEEIFDPEKEFKENMDWARETYQEYVKGVYFRQMAESAKAIEGYIKKMQEDWHELCQGLKPENEIQFVGPADLRDMFADLQTKMLGEGDKDE